MPSVEPTVSRVATPNAIGENRVPEIDDPLAEALHLLRMEGVFYCRSELTAPWGIDMPALPDCVYFHVVTSGACQIDIDGTLIDNQAGDLMVVAHGSGHAAVDAAGSPTTSVFDIPHQYVTRQYALLRHGGGGATTNVICGAVRFRHPAARALVAMLPQSIHVPASTTREGWEWMPALLDLMAQESITTQPGGEAVVTRLSDVLVIQAIRHWIATDPAADTGWLGALRDPLIGQAVAAIHREPERAWTVAELASSVAMSRSSFSARFTEKLGEAPMQYLTWWRMHLAVDLLREEQLTVAQTAHRLGYATEASFGRAFRRVMGAPPGAVRRMDDELDPLMTV